MGGRADQLLAQRLRPTPSLHRTPPGLRRRLPCFGRRHRHHPCTAAGRMVLLPLGHPAKITAHPLTYWRTLLQSLAMTTARTAVRPSRGTGRRPARRRPATRGRPKRRRSARRPATGRASTRKRTAGRRRRSGRRLAWMGAWWPALLVAAAVLVGVAWESAGGPTVSELCPVSGSSLTLSPEQVTNAVTIAGVAHDRGLPE